MIVQEDFGLVLTLRGQCQRIGAEVALWLRQLRHFWSRAFRAGVIGTGLNSAGAVPSG